MRIEIFSIVASFWSHGIVTRICSCVTIVKTCNSPITSVSWTKISKTFMYSPRQKIVIKKLFWRWRNGDIIVLAWYLCLFFGKYQNDLTFSATVHFSLKLGTRNYSDSKSPRGDFIRSWWHLMISEVHI